MGYTPGSLARPSRPINQARKWVVSICVAIVAAVLLKPDIVQVVISETRSINDYLYLGLLALNVLVGAGWVWVTSTEFELLVHWLDPEEYNPPTDIREWLTILILGLLLVVQLLSVRYPIAYGTLFVATSTWVLFAVRHLNHELGDAIQGSRVKLEEATRVPHIKSAGEIESYEKALGVLDAYFLKKPHLKRYAISILFGLVGLGFAVYAKTIHSNALKSVSYLVFIIYLLASETLINVWRYERDSAIRKIEARLDKLKRIRREASPRLGEESEGDERS